MRADALLLICCILDHESVSLIETQLDGIGKHGNSSNILCRMSGDYFQESKIDTKDEPCNLSLIHSFVNSIHGMADYSIPYLKISICNICSLSRGISFHEVSSTLFSYNKEND